jgi:hypothetical protein
VDATGWTIKGKNHFDIYFESGDGAWATPKDIGKYAWYRERVIKGHTVRFALIRPGLKTVWEPQNSRGVAPGNILLVSYILWNGTKLYSQNSANFKAKVTNSAELGDALLMILSFDPSKVNF